MPPTAPTLAQIRAVRDRCQTKFGRPLIGAGGTNSCREADPRPQMVLGRRLSSTSAPREANAGRILCDCPSGSCSPPIGRQENFPRAPPQMYPTPTRASPNAPRLRGCGLSFWQTLSLLMPISGHVFNLLESLAGIGPNSETKTGPTKVARLRAKFDRFRVKFGRSWANSTQIWSSLCRIWPNSVEGRRQAATSLIDESLIRACVACTRPISTDVDPISAMTKFGKTRRAFQGVAWPLVQISFRATT